MPTDGPVSSWAQTVRVLGIADARSVHTHKWAGALAARGHAVHIVSYSALLADSASGLAPGISVDEWTLPLFHVKRLVITLGALARLRGIARRFRPDIVHAHFLGVGAWYAAVARLRPLVVSVMGGGDVIGTKWRPTNRVERLLTPYTLRRAKLVTCWSRNLRGAVAPLLKAGQRCEVLVGGVDTALFRPYDGPRSQRPTLIGGEGDFVVISPRLLWPRQNIHLIVEAVGRLQRKLARARLVIVRYCAEHFPEYVQRVEAMVRESGISTSVRFVDTVPYREMPAYYQAADCVVSVPETDGTPMTVMESAACGTPVVVHDLPDYDPAIFVHEKTVLRVPLNDPAALASAMYRIATEPALRHRLQENGRHMTQENADYGREMDRLEGFYSAIVSRH
jgi:glycosyltransferase involved in cell wall biosynthesis